MRRIASLHGTEWSNLPSMKSQRKQALIHDRTKQNPISVKIHHVHVPTRGICKITDEQLRHDTRQIQTLLNQVTSKETYGDRAREIIPLFQYIYTHPCILFLNPRLLDIVIRKVEELTTQITRHETNLQEYFDAADRMSAALSYPQREIGNEILKEGMKQKVEEWKVWYDLKSVLIELSEIFPTTKCEEPSTKCEEPAAKPARKCAPTTNCEEPVAKPSRKCASSASSAC